MPRVQHSLSPSMLPEVTRPVPGAPKGPWVLEQLRTLSRAMAPGELFPSDRVLASRYGVARMTVRGQLDALVEEGLLERKPGRGTFVRRPGSVIGDIPLSFTADMRAKGLRPSSQVLAFRRTAATIADRKNLHLNEADKVLQIVRVRYADEIPMSLERVRIPCRLVPGLTRSRLGQGSLYELLSSDYGIVVDNADQTVRVDWSSPADLALIDLPRGSVTLHLERIARDKMGRLIEHASSLYRADRYQVEMHVAGSRMARSRSAEG